MGVSTVNTPSESGSPVESGARPTTKIAPLGLTVALTVTLALACFTVVMAVVGLLVEPTPVAGFNDYTQRQDAESALYLIALAIVVLALILVPRLADGIAAGPNRDALSLVAAVLAGTFAASILIARAIPGGLEGLLVIVGVWSGGAAALLARVRRGSAWPALTRSPPIATAAWGMAGALVLAAVVAFVALPSISAVGTTLGAVAGGAVIAVVARRGTALPAVPKRWGAAIDVAIVLLLLAVVPDLDFLQTDAAASGDQLAAIQRPVVQFHQNFYLGPANEVLHGGAMLVDTASQYGVGSIYLLAGWFQLVPIGYGMLGLLDAVLFGLLLVAAYGVLRIAGVSRLLAASALTVGVVALIYNLLYPVGSLLQHGPLRFGLPMLVILAAAAGARWPRCSGAALAVQAAVVGLSSVWALEGFAYTLATFAAIACFEAWTGPAVGRWRWLARRVAAAAGACAAAHLLLVAATLAAAGQLPDWGQYGAYLRAFLAGGLGELTYDFSSWSGGLPLGAGYLASAAALLLLVHRRPAVLSSQRATLVALAGTTAYGVALFSYFVNRSADHILPYVALPALIVAALWVSLLMRGALAASRPPRVAGLAFALAVAVLLVAVAWSSVADRAAKTPLAYLSPGGESLRSALGGLRDAAPIDPRAPHGERLLSRYMPGESRVPMLVFPDLETEILLRSGRANALGLGYTREDSFVPSERLPGLERALAQLQAGDPILLQTAGLRAFAAYRADPSRDPLDRPIAPSSLAPLQEWALRWIAQRFALRAVDQDEQGFVVARLSPRPGT